VDKVPFQALSVVDRRDALEIAASLGGRRAPLLEKDIWVVQTLSALIQTSFGADLTFTGGSSLAKAYQAISRFSEDLDITHDIRSMAPDLVAESGHDPIPKTLSQERFWTRAIGRRLANWVASRAITAVETNFAEAGLSAQLRVEGDRLYVAYESLFLDHALLRPEVMVDFGARSTGEPRQELLNKCDAAQYIPDVDFPSIRSFVMLAERTFWEKATAMHVYCRQRRRRGERLSRHWYDLARLDDSGFSDKALADHSLGISVARHKSMFYREKDAAGNWVDYIASVSGGLQLVPEGPARQSLADDYDKMVSDGILLDDEEPFDDLMERCAEIQNKANGH
jgi:hypothetical protein